MDNGTPEAPLERYRVRVEGFVLGEAGLGDLEAVRGVLGVTCRSITLRLESGDPAWNRLFRRSQLPLLRRSTRLQYVLKAVSESRARQATRNETPWSAELVVAAADEEQAMDAGETITTAAFESGCGIDVLVHRTEVRFGNRWFGQGHVRARLGRPFSI